MLTLAIKFIETLPAGQLSKGTLETRSSHGLAVIAMAHVTVIEGFRSTCRSVRIALLAINLLALLVTGANLELGNNYMNTLQKPATASLFDHMGPWPWYLVYTELLALALFSLLYLPFVLTRSRRDFRTD